MRKPRYLALAILVVIWGCGGGGGGSPSPPPVVSVEVAPDAATVSVGTTQQFTATVQNATNPAVLWSVSGPGCSGSACGTISAGGLYTAPAAVPSPPTVTVMATSMEDATKSCPASVTVTSSVTVSTWPGSAQVEVGGTRQFGVQVLGSANTAVNWSVSGPGCSGAACGTISAAGLYTAPAGLPSPAAVTVTARPQADPGKSSSAAVTLLESSYARLTGRYAYYYQGYGLNEPGTCSGYFVADGFGHITGGVLDRTWLYAPGVNLADEPIPGGTYSVYPDGRGTMTWNFPFGAVTFSFALNAAGETGLFQAFYDSSTKTTGTFVRQDDPPFSASDIQGDYVFLLNGTDNDSVRMAALGRISADGGGTLTGTLDVNYGTSAQTGLGLTGSYAVGSNGRGTATLTIGTLGTFSYALHAVSGDRFILQSIDTVMGDVPMLGGWALKQSGGPFSKASLHGTAVFDLIGRPGPDQARVSVGLMIPDGNGAVTGIADINNNNVISANTPFTATYDIGANGRGTLASSVLPDSIFYLVRPNTGLLMEAVGSPVQTGSFEPQSAMTYGDEVLIGQYVSGGSTPPPYFNNGTVTGVVTWNTPGSYTHTIDINSTTGGLVSGSSGSGTTSVAANGRVVVSSGGGTAYMYLVSPVKYVEILGTGFPTSPDDQKHLYKAEQ